MMIESFRQTGYKREAVELTAEALVAAQYGTVWEGAAIMVNDGETNERRPDRATFAALQSVGGAYFGDFKGAFEPRPSGTDATAPDWYQLATASGATVTTDVLTWGAESTSSAIIGDTVTLKTRDGALEKVLAGARVQKLRFFAEKGVTWACECEAVGRYSESTQTAFVAAAHPSTGLGQPFLGMACTVGAFAGSVASVEISIDGKVTPTKDGTHATGYGRNVVTERKLMFRAQLIEEGSVDWHGKARNDAADDLLTVSCVMSSGSAGNVLTWTGTICLTKTPEVTYVDGIGYRSIEGEFITTSASAALTLTQS